MIGRRRRADDEQGNWRRRRRVTGFFWRLKLDRNICPRWRNGLQEPDHGVRRGADIGMADGLIRRPSHRALLSGRRSEKLQNPSRSLLDGNRIEGPPVQPVLNKVVRSSGMNRGQDRQLCRHRFAQDRPECVGERGKQEQICERQISAER